MQLPYYKKVFALMVKVYKRQLSIKPQDPSESIRESPKDAGVRGGKKRAALTTLETTPATPGVVKNVKITRFNAYFLCVHLGWLFEHQNFPRELFISPMGPNRERNDSGGSNDPAMVSD